ncbi:ADP-ribosylglycohydrolase family protein [Trinickia dabaoshanensis]|uniref:ADP-ribosylglycohydrolase family protein n=1 Tax=Trinickia dabaoshanensis TaxID=564714 RepID=UPI001E5AB33C|nr:ADP-ribosylglycohydrolase family protein [Trinickia dabaoshanensis]
MTGHETHKSHAQAVRSRVFDIPAGERFEGCLLGGAVGDALGAPVEFMPRDEIVRRFGPGGITEYASAYGRIGAITDDTQMTLFTAEGLLRAWVRGCLKGVSTYSGVTSHAYLRWLLTQGLKPTNRVMIETDEMGWLFRQPELHHRRAPGNTCLSALQETQSLGKPATNSSKGCGGVMRVAPVGLFGAQNMSEMEVFDLGVELAALTHGHPTGSLTGGCLAAMVHALVQGRNLQVALDIAKRILVGKAQHEETLHAIEAAERLATSALPREVAIAELGQGWVAEEALAISVYCALVAKDFRDGIILAVNHDGDSDSTGSITGNLLGTMLGVTAIPSHWLDALELRSVIAELAGDLCRYREWDMSDNSPNHHLVRQVWEKYPGF